MKRFHHAPAFVVALSLLSLLALAMTGWAEMRARSQVMETLNFNIAEMTRIDEVLTASALLATATGDPLYSNRYLTNVEELDRLIDASIALVTSSDARGRLNGTRAANLWLMRAERRAIEAAADGPDVAAYASLRSGAYVHFKEVYDRGLRETMDLLRFEAEAGVTRVQRMLWALGIIGLTAALYLLRLTLATQMEREAIERERRQMTRMRGMLGTFMDLQNNLLNNMVYFRTKAAHDLSFDAEDVRMIDVEIAAAKAKLSDLADTGIATTRDLGGIVVAETGGADERKVA